MKFATRIKIIIVLAACMAITLIAGCSIGEMTAERFLKDKGAQDKCVTYSASGGVFNDNSNLLLLHLYYPAENEVIYDFSKASNISVARAGYVFNGWVYAKTDDAGKPLYDEKGYLVPSENAVDTSVSVTLKPGEHLYLCAVWVPDVRVDVVLVIDGDTDGTKTITGTDGTKYKTGDVIEGKIFNASGTVNISSAIPSIASSDYTFLQYYKDENCTEIMKGTLTRPTDGSSVNPKIYAKYIEGVWTVVRTYTQAANMLNTPVEGASYYLYTEDGSNVIDCSSRALSLKTYNSGDAFKTNCTIAGNGVTLKNLNFRANVDNGQISSVFGVFGSNANISNLTIENLNVTVTARRDLTVYLVNHSVEAGAKFDNVNINGASLTLTIPSSGTISNIQKTENGYDTSDWLCGGGLQSINVTGAKLTINNVPVVE